MSVVHCDTLGLGSLAQPVVPAAVSPPLHRLAAARKQQGVSRYAMARRLNIDVAQVQQQERETTDLTLSTLHAWQRALQLPIAELLVEADDSLSLPVLRRSQLLRLMKTVLAIGEHAKQVAIRRMAETMAEQLIEIMPELAEVAPWHGVGKRRSLSELGVAAERRLSDDLFIETDE